MSEVTSYPLLVLVLSFFVLWLSTWIGSAVLKRRRDLEQEEREDFGVLMSATLTLLGLLVGFSFSMAIGRYDQRKTYEEAEANAIGTEYVRADLLPPADATKVRALLKNYVDQRILFYVTRDDEQLRQIDVRTTRLQADLWSAVVAPATARPSPIAALAVAGMNDVLNSQGYTQAAWWNRIPVAAWALMGLIAIASNLMLGYSAKYARAKRILHLVLPLIVSTSFFLVADIDSPRRGVIRVHPQNLESLAGALRAQ